MIYRACYVVCDGCGDPAPISTEGAKEARIFARQVGYTRKRGQDICARCQGKTSYSPHRDRR